MADLDQNTWCQMTEDSVNFTPSLQSSGCSLGIQAIGGQNEYWQIFPVAKSSFQVRSRSEGLINQLPVCYSAEREQDAPVHAAGRWRRQPEMGHRALGRRELHVRRRQERLWLPYGLPPGQPTLHEFRDHGDA